MRFFITLLLLASVGFAQDRSGRRPLTPLPGLKDDGDTARQYIPPNYTLPIVKPALGAAFSDPLFSTGIKRVTDAAALGIAGAYHNYSSHSAFNSNCTYLLIERSDGGAYVVDLAGNIIEDNTTLNILGSSEEAKWSRTDPNLIYYCEADAVGEFATNQLRSYNIATNVRTIVRTFTGYTNISFGRGEGDISEDGDHLPIEADGRYMMVYKISTDEVGTAFDAGSAGLFDNTDLTPDNNFIVGYYAAGVGDLQGTQLYNKNGTRTRQVYSWLSHNDRGRDSDGSEIIVSNTSNDGSAPGLCAGKAGYEKVKLSDSTKTCLAAWNNQNEASHAAINNVSGFPYALLSYTDVHVAGAPNTDGQTAEVAASLPADWSNTTRWRNRYLNSIFLVKLDGTETRFLAHHRSRRDPAGGNYWYSPRATICHRGDHIAFDSNFAVTSTADYADVYVMTIRTPSSDLTAPVLSAQSSGTPATTSATITWTTSEPATSQVEYGTSTFYGTGISAFSPTLTTSHSVNVTGLTAGTLYNYRIKSRDLNGNYALDSNRTFTTALSDFVTDAFAEATVDTTLASHTGAVGATWTIHPDASYVSTATVDFTLDRLFGLNTTAYYASGVPPSADYYVQADFHVADLANVNSAICLRMDITANTMYLLRLNVGATWEVRKIVAGVQTTLSSSTANAPGVGAARTMRLVISGSTITVLNNGVQDTALNATDTAITATGKAGVRFAGAMSPTTGCHLKLFSAR